MPKGHPLSESAKERIWELRAKGLIHTDLQPGSYYAVVRAHFDEGFGYCQRVRSREVTISR
jgi:hypothetical protein